MNCFEARSYATAKIIDCGSKKASFSLDMDAVVRVFVKEGGDKITCKDKTAGDAAKSVKKHFKFKGSAKIEVESHIPPRIGLGEKEAIRTAAVLAMIAAVAHSKKGSVNELKIDKFLKTQFAVIDRRVVSKKKIIDLCTAGCDADRVAAAIYGGFAVVDEKKGILRRGEMEDLGAVIFPLKNKKDFLAQDVAGGECDLIFEEVLKGDLYRSMKMNAYMHGIPKNVMRRMKDFITVTFSGSSFIGLVRGKHAPEGAKGGGIAAKITNNEASILSKPRRIMKAGEFMNLDGAENFDFL